MRAADVHGQPFCDINIDRRPVNVSERASFANALKTGALLSENFRPIPRYGQAEDVAALVAYWPDRTLAPSTAPCLTIDRGDNR